MRAIAINIVILNFCLSAMTFGLDVALLSPLGISPTTLDGGALDVDGLAEMDQAATGNLLNDGLNPQYQGDVIDRITQFSTGGFDAVWTMFSLLTGGYYFSWATALGVPQFWIYILQGTMGFAGIITIIKYIRGVE